MGLIFFIIASVLIALQILGAIALPKVELWVAFFFVTAHWIDAAVTWVGSHARPKTA